MGALTTRRDPRRRSILLAFILAATTFTVDAAPVSLPGPLDEALGPVPVQAGFCASNAAFTGRLTGSSASTTALARTTSPTVYGYISNVNAAWSCTLYYRYSGITWNTSATLGTFRWGNLINSAAVACNFVVGSTDYLKGNSTSDCPDTDAEYALSASLSPQGVYQRDVNHNSVGDFSFVQTDCGTYYGGAIAPITGHSWSTGTTANRPGVNCDPIDTDDTNTAQTITYDSTNPTVAVTTPASGSATDTDTLSKTVTFNPSDNVAGFGGSYLWRLQRQIASITSPGTCGTFANDTATGHLVTGTAQGSQNSIQTLVAAKCYRWLLSAEDQNGNGPVTTSTPGTVLVDTLDPATDFSTPNEGTTATVNTAGYSVGWTETEAHSGIASRSLQRQRVLSATCTGSFTNDGSPATGASPVAATLTTGYCYQWVQTLTDAAGNSSVKTSGKVYYNGASPAADFSTPNEGSTTLQTGTSYSVAWSESAGAGSITARSLQRQKGTIVTPSSCAGVSWSNDGAADTGTSPRNPAGVLSGGSCYRWIQTLTNTGGQIGASTSGSVLVDTTAPAATISYPAAAQTIGGDVVVTGAATDAHSFLDYTLEYGVGASPGSWTTIVTSTDQVPATGDLAVWPTSALAGTYTLRLTVRESAGHSADIDSKTVYIENLGRGEEPFLTRVPFDLGGGLRLDVGVHNGEARLSRELFSIPSYGPPQALDLAYSSLESSTTGRFGAGWHSNLTQYLTFSGTDLIIWHRADGGIVPFGLVGATWTPPAGHHEALAIDGGANEVSITRADQTAFVFEDAGAGRLERIEDRFGHALTLAWSTSSATVTDDSGRVTDITIDSGTGEIDEVEDSAGRLWEFDYDGNGDLIGLTDPEGALTEFGYDGSHRLTDIIRERSRVAVGDETIDWSIGYTTGQATSLTDPIDTNAHTFTYGPGTTEVDLLRDDSAPTYDTWSYAFDAAGRVTEQIDPAGFVTSTEYDADSNPIEIAVPVGTGSAQATTSYTYDAAGNVLIEERELDGVRSVLTVNSYNATNDLATRSEADGDAGVKLVTRYTYDGGGHLTSVNVNCTTSGTTPPATASTCTGAGTQDAATNLITSYAYSADDQLEFEQDPLGRVTKHDYDSHGNEITTIADCTSSGTTLPSPFDTCTAGGTIDAATNVETAVAVNAAGLPTTITDPVGNATSYTYDSLGRQLTEILAGDGTIPALTRTTTYDELGNVLTEIEAWDPIGPASTVTHTTTHAYDLANRETNQTDPAGVETITTYDAAGNATSTDSGGVTSTRTFDGLGRVLLETTDSGDVSHVYDAQGNEITTASAEGTVTERSFNYAGWLAGEIVDPTTLALTTTHTYDVLGRETASVDPQSVTTANTYDRTGRLIETVTDVRSTTTVYDRVGNSLTVRAPDGAASATIVDRLDRPTSSIANCTNSGTTQPAAFTLCTGSGTQNDTTNLVTTTYYDAAGTAIAQRDAKGIATRTIANARGLAAETIANCTDSGSTPTSDPPACVGAGSATATTNVSTTATYDGRGAAVLTVTAVGTGAQATTETAYDAAGRVQAIKDPLGTITRSLYDPDDGRLVESIVNCTHAGTTPQTSGWETCDGAGTANGTFNLSTTYAYDARGNQTTVIAPNGRETRSLYDQDDRLIARIDDYVDGTPSAADDLTTSYFYDEAGRQSGTLAPTTDGTVLVATRIEYNADGTVAREIRDCTDAGTTVPANAGTCSGSGTKDADTNISTSYTYDDRGNRITMSTDSPAETSGAAGTPIVTQYAYDAANRLCRVVENATGTTNLQALTGPGEHPCLTATQTSGTTTTNVSTRYTYDDAGNLASMINAAGETTSYGYDENGRMTSLTDPLGEDLVWTYDPLGNRTREYDRRTPLTPNVDWTYDGAGRLLTRTADPAASSDATAPTVPAGLDATGQTDRIDLSWDAAADAVGVTSYTIERGGSYLAQVSGQTTTFADRTVAPSTAYSYTVSASDAAGNSSSPSSSDGATSGAGAPGIAAADTFTRTTAGWGTADTGGAWTNQNTTDITTTGSVGRHSVPSATTRWTRLGGLSVADQEGLLKVKVSSLAGSGSVAYTRIETRADAAYDNYYRFQLQFASSGALAMVMRKTVAGSVSTLRSDSNVVTGFTASDSVWLRWKVTNAGADVALTYKLWKDGTAEPGSFATTYTDSAPGATFTGAGRLQLTSQVIGYSGGFPYTLDYDDLSISGGADTTAPSLPTDLSASAAGATQVDLAWTASTDASGVAGYRIYRGGSLLTTVGSTTWSDTGLSASTAYSYTVSAIDAATNASAQTGAQVATTTAVGQTTYTYDAAGNRLTAAAGPHTIRATYDRLNRVLTVDDEDAGSAADTTYTYHLTAPSWTDPSGAYAATLDAFDRPLTLDDPVNGTDFTWTYRADGQPASLVEPNANTTAFAYDDVGRLTSKDTTAAGPTNRALYDWTYNRAGAVLAEDSVITSDPDNGLISYAYDALGRLTDSTVSATTTAYGWDEVTNRTSVQVGAGTPATTAYDAANRPTSGTAPSATYTSDEDGRLTARPGQTLVWDDLGRLIRVVDPSGPTTLASYTYDPLDRLRQIDDGTDRTRLRYVGLTTATAQLIDDETHAVSRHIANGWTGERLLDWTGVGSNLRYYGTNAHHDVTWLGLSSGSVSQSVRYDPWGTERSAAPSGYTPFRFQGSLYDEATELSWVITRWYAPALGRFVSEDSLLGEPVQPDSRHLYAYAEGEPIGRWDPDGRHWYGVKVGDSLRGLSKRFYGTENLSWRISRGNPGGKITPVNLNLVKASLAGKAGKCIWIPFTQRANSCPALNARGDSVARGSVLWRRFDGINAYVARKMRERTVDGVDGLGILNLWPPGDINISIRFAQLTRERGPWDIKHDLEKLFGHTDRRFWTAVRDDPAPETFRSDLWGLIHFGYVGRAHGFGVNTLRAANKVFGGAQGAADNRALEIGMRLWTQFGAGITATRLRYTVLGALPGFRRDGGNAVKPPLHP